MVGLNVSQEASGGTAASVAVVIMYFGTFCTPVLQTLDTTDTTMTVQIVSDCDLLTVCENKINIVSLVCGWKYYSITQDVKNFACLQESKIYCTGQSTVTMN